MSAHSRTYNSVANSIYGIGASFITVALNFVVRIVLVRQLGEEINGINSLFQSVISMMALMEMGISSAMIIHLYEPVKNKDQNVIAGIMSFYRKIYLYVAVAFTIVGILISLFVIDDLVTSSIPTNTVRIYFLFFTACFVANYLTYYKRSILFAEQKNRISTGITAVCEIVFRGMQIALLLVWQNYILFLIILMIEKVVSNLICQYYVDKQHPYLRKNKVVITSEKKKAIFDTVKPLMVYQTASTLQGTATSILISLLLGNVAIVGYYGVYQMVISVISLLFSQLGGAFTTSFGNLAVENDHSHMEEVFKKSSFVFNGVACICAALFIACADDFINIFFGKNFVLGRWSVLLLALQMLTRLLNIPAISVQNAMGLHKYVRDAVVIQALIAIVLGYVGGLLFGMPGILIGLTLPTIFISLFRNGAVVTNKAFSMKKKRFIGFLVFDIIRVAMTIVCVNTICLNLELEPSFTSILIKGVIALILSFAIFGITSYRRPEFKQVVGLVKSHKFKI